MYRFVDVFQIGIRLIFFCQKLVDCIGSMADLVESFAGI